MTSQPHNNNGYANKIDLTTNMCFLVLVLVLSDMASAETVSEISQDMDECAKIEDHAERLKCYDNLAGQKSRNIEPAKESAERGPEGKEEKASYFSRLWELDEGARREKYATHSSSIAKKKLDSWL